MVLDSEPASGTRNPEGGYPADEKKFSVTSRMDPVFISLSIGSKLPLTIEMKTGTNRDVTENIFSSGGYPPSGLRVPEAVYIILMFARI